MKGKDFVLYGGLFGYAYLLLRFVWYCTTIAVMYLYYRKGIHEGSVEWIEYFYLFPSLFVLPGAIMGDVIKSNKWGTIAGALMAFVGLIWFAITISFAFIGPVGLLLLGFGFMWGNQVAWFGRLCRQRPEYLVPGFVLYYVLIQLGYTVGSDLVMGTLDRAYIFATVAGMLVLIYTTAIYFVIPAFAERRPLPAVPGKWRVLVPLALLLLTVPCWLGLKFAMSLMDGSLTAADDSSSVSYSVLDGLQMVSGVVLAVLLYKKRFPMLLSMAIACVLLLLATGMALLIQSESLANGFLDFGSSYLVDLSELLLYGVGSALVLRSVPERWLGTALAILHSLAYFVFHLHLAIKRQEIMTTPLLYTICIVAGLSGALVYGLLYLYAPRRIGGRVGEG